MIFWPGHGAAIAQLINRLHIPPNFGLKWVGSVSSFPAVAFCWWISVWAMMGGCTELRVHMRAKTWPIWGFEKTTSFYRTQPLAGYNRTYLRAGPDCFHPQPFLFLSFERLFWGKLPLVFLIIFHSLVSVRLLFLKFIPRHFLIIVNLRIILLNMLNNSSEYWHI